ncbi:MAG: hypothetical protein K2N58_06415 [Treponemataceae bacterium]|nr:hypothetical protein [Treponemataceae bacterium]
MKKLFKLAAIAVSMALVTSLVACSSGDDDVVDATTPEYLLKAQIDKYVASIKYDQNVSDDEIKPLKKAHEAMMDMLGDCAKCLEVYFDDYLQDELNLKYFDELDRTPTLEKINYVVDYLKELKEYYGTDKKFHEKEVYLPAMDKALNGVVGYNYAIWYDEDGTLHEFPDYKSEYERDNARLKVSKIGDPKGDTILKGELNDRQSESMKTYTDAVETLKNALNDDDKKTCKKSIDDADAAIKAFNDLKNKNVDKDKIDLVITAVDNMHYDIYKNVYRKKYDAFPSRGK